MAHSREANMSDEQDEEGTGSKILRRIFMVLGGLVLAVFLVFGLCTLAVMSS
jgi:hypothetical protein